MSSSPAPASPGSASPGSASPGSALGEAMAVRVARGEFPGLVALVARDDDVRVEAVGVTAFGGDVPMRRETPFRIASMTKPVIAAVTMMLAEDGLLDLEEPVARLLPELAGQRVLARPDGPLDETVPPVRPVTVADLLTFTSGLGHLIVGDRVDPPVPVVERWHELELQLGGPHPRTPHDPDEWIRRFGSLPLMRQPGDAWLYNAGFMVLGVLLARAAGRPLDRLLRERVFEPLGMGDTGFWLPADRAAELPQHYQGGTATTFSGPDDWSSPPSFPSGAGGLVSTADDYLAFARMLLAGGVHGGTRLLSEQSVAAMTTNHLTDEQIASGGFFLSGSGWGYGMAVTVEADEVSGPGRYGWSGGFGTDWFNDPAAGLVFIMLGQVSDLLWGDALPEFCRLASAK